MRSTAVLGGRDVYFLCHGNAAGYPRHLTLDPEEILTFVGSCCGDVEAGWIRRRATRTSA